MLAIGGGGVAVIGALYYFKSKRAAGIPLGSNVFEAARVDNAFINNPGILSYLQTSGSMIRNQDRSPMAAVPIIGGGARMNTRDVLSELNQNTLPGGL